MRSIRRLTQVLLTLVGGAMVAYAVYRVDPLRERLVIAVVGLVIMQLGIWQVANVLFPNQRDYKPLREETDYFIKLVRRLNRAAVAAERGSSNARDEMDSVHAEMHHSVDRMKRLAGQTDVTAGSFERDNRSSSSTHSRPAETRDG
jgi:hypothetical protein